MSEQDKKPKQNHERFATYEGALSTYKHETGNIVYNSETFEKFGKWLYAKCCDDDCPFYRIVEGDGTCRPRCTNPGGHCVDEGSEK